MGMEPLQPAVSGTSFRFRADLLASPTASRSLAVTPRTPPAVSYRALLARVHNPELRKVIVAERKEAVARANREAMSRQPLVEKRRLQTPPTPDISGEWSYYQSGQARDKRRLERFGEQERGPRDPLPCHQARRVPIPVPPAATARLQARDVARAFDVAHATRDYWTQPARKFALNPPPRTLSNAERCTRVDGSSRQQTVIKQLRPHPWRARW
eukprot:COSAG02_NODE_1020_length_15166_cov_48.849671_7_plen_213_part_00